MPKLEERRFVVFEAAVVDVDQIVAMIDLPPNAKRPAPTIAIIMEKGSPIMLDGMSMWKAIQWWKENVEVEKIVLKEPPPPPEVPPEPVPVSPVTAPVKTPAPAATAIPTVPAPVAPVPITTPVVPVVPVVAEPEGPTLADMLNIPPVEPV